MKQDAMLPCRAVVSPDGSPCARRALKGSQYCYRHTFFRFKGIPVLKNGTVHIFALFAVFLVSGFYFLDRPARDWLSLMYNMNREIEATERLRSCLDQQESISRAALSETYSAGYALFAVDRHRRYAYREAVRRDSFGIDWDQFRVVQITDEAVWVVPPGLFFKGRACLINGTIFAVPRGEPESAFQCGSEKMRVSLYVLRDTGDAIVMVLGFSES